MEKVVIFATGECSMPGIQKVSIALTGEQVHALTTAVESGEYATTSEIVREALREWQRKRELRAQNVERLQQLWVDGKQSGPSVEASLLSIRQKARQRLKAAVPKQLPHAS